jgi:proline dehydrogenase
MLRQSLLFLSDSPVVQRVVTETPVSRRLAARFVAGDNLDEAVACALSLNDAGLTVTMDYLGEQVTAKEEALAATEMAVRTLERLADSAVRGNISLKPTQLGLEIDEAFCYANVERILRRADELSEQPGEIFVRLDMESSEFTEATIRLVEAMWEGGHRNVGTVVQAYLRRTPGDLGRLNRLGSRVRLVKGAYREPPSVAFPRKGDVDESFVECMKTLLEEGVYPAIATHDENLIAATRRYAFEQGIPRDSFEFQMLYGIRRDLQQRLREEGYHVRVYLPFGSSWYGYLMRRMAERPANFFFVASNVARETPIGRAGRPFALGAGVVTGALAALAWRGRNSK